MEHLILTETSFFRLIGGSACNDEIQESYNGFISEVVSLCSNMSNPENTFFALSFAETELQFHDMLQAENTGNSRSIYVRKALSFVRKMLEYTGQIRSGQVHTPQAERRKEKKNSQPLQWTGNAIDLVEIIYGIHEMGCINNGEISLKQLAPILYSFFGVETKDCYRFYTDIKRRKTISHTHFLEQMQERLNERIRRDEEAELKRR